MTTPHQFSADRPIERLDEDRLQRRAFAESIARAITTWHGDDSLVLALYGGWGDGKTSVKGMVVDAMKEDANTCPYIVHFNPWEWAGQKQLSQVFFDEIGKQIAHQGGGEDKKAVECGRRLQKLGKYLNLAGAFMTPLGYAAMVAIPFANIVTEAAAKGLEESAKLVKQAGEAVQEQKDREASDLLKVKSELKEALTDLKRNVVVFMDDIDRLAADEIKLLFQLVKANSDFPNLSFFLFFQRDIIERALAETIKTGTGKDYLEKIVQVPLSLPHIQRPLLENLMESKLREVLKRRGFDARFDWSRFRELWEKGVGDYFQNVRDAARFFGTYEFQLASFLDPTEIDPVDLFALEVLRVGELGVYEALATAKEVLGRDAFTSYQHHAGNEALNEKWTKAIERIVETGKTSRREAVSKILQVLFPVETFTLADGGIEITRLQRDARVGHLAYFGRYFHLCIPRGDVPQSTLKALVGAVGKPRSFKRLLIELDKHNLALEALARLCAYAEQFDNAHACSIALALFDSGDKLVGRYSDDHWKGFAAISCCLIEAHIQKLPDRDTRFATLKRSLQGSTGIYLPAKLVSREESRANDHVKNYAPPGISREQRGILETTQLDALRAICVESFEKAAKSGTLEKHPKLREVLRWWVGWSRQNDTAKVYFRRVAATGRGLANLLEHYLGGKLSDDMRERVAQSMFDEGLNEIEMFMPADEIKNQVEKLAQKTASKRVASLCFVFLEIYEEHKRRTGAISQSALRAPPTHHGHGPAASPEPL